MKTLLSFLFLLFACSQPNAQPLYPIIIESYKHVNVYNYNSKADMEECINISIKLKKKNNRKIMSDALLASGFEFNNVNDTLLIATSHSDVAIWAPPYTLLAKSSKSVKLLSECDSINGVYKEDRWLIEPNPSNPPLSYYRTNAYAFMVFMMDDDPNKYAENYFKILYPKYPDMAKEYYLKEMSGEYPQNYYSIMYQGDVDAFRELYIKNIGIILGGYDTVLRIVIKDGKVVPPTLIWSY